MNNPQDVVFVSRICDIDSIATVGSAVRINSRSTYLESVLIDGRRRVAYPLEGDRAVGLLSTLDFGGHLLLVDGDGHIVDDSGLGRLGGGLGTGGRLLGGEGGLHSGRELERLRYGRLLAADDTLVTAVAAVGSEGEGAQHHAEEGGFHLVGNRGVGD